MNHFNPHIFDQKLWIARRTRQGRNTVDFLQKHVQNDFDDRLSSIKRTFKNSLYLSEKQLINEVLQADNSAHDLLVSNLHFHRVNDLPGVLLQMRRALKPDGLFLAALFGGETLYELRDVLAQTEIALRDGISPRVHPMVDKQQAGALLQRAGFTLPVVDSDVITVTYSDIFKLIYDLRGMGETNIIAARDKRYVGRQFFTRAAESYAAKYSDPDGRIRATFEIIYLCGWSPHQSQQTPAPRGSGQINLNDAL
jgi:NADH dehydrogenase [ubiquinone] 1 alpha subcomplex assembly factor 5